MKKLGLLCLFVPFVFNTLNVQAFISKFVSGTYSQYFAYMNVGLVILGTLIFIKHKESFTPIIKLWIWFFVLYFIIGTIASFIHDTDSPYLKTSIPVFYFLGYAVLLSIDKYRPLFIKVCTAAFFCSVIFVIIFKRLNFSMDHDGIYEYALDRAGGVYGDANQSALVCILSFILIYYFFNPINGFLKVLKTLAILISLYALVITFSKTGFLVLIVVLGLIFHKLFNAKRILFTAILVPILFIGGINFALKSETLTPIQKDRVENIVDILTFNTGKVEMSNRDVLLQNMLKYVFDNPVLGNGVYFSTAIRGHNTIIGVWADAGIVCFILFLIILFNYFRKAMNGKTETEYFSLAVMITLTVFMLSLQTIINQPYLLCLLIYLAYHIEKSSRDSEGYDELAV